MSNAGEASGITTPWHVWIVGIVALLWNSMGAFDYTMTETRNAAYLSSFTPEQLAFFDGFPKWTIATWALSVWGGVLGSVALLLRRRWATPIFAMSLATMMLTFFHNFVLADGLSVMGGAAGLVFTAVIVVVAMALLAYSRALATRGILRK